MSAPSLSTEAGLAGNYPSQRFNQRERKLLESVKTYVDNSAPNNVITTEGDLIIGDSSGDAIRLAKGSSGLPLVAGASTSSYTALSATGLASGSVTLAKLDAGITPSHIVVAAGEFTTVGGDTSESITVAGALATDLAFVVVKTLGMTPVSITAAAAASGAIDVTTSADPSNDHVLCYQLIRAAS